MRYIFFTIALIFFSGCFENKRDFTAELLVLEKLPKQIDRLDLKENLDSTFELKNSRDVKVVTANLDHNTTREKLESRLNNLDSSKSYLAISLKEKLDFSYCENVVCYQSLYTSIDSALSFVENSGNIVIKDISPILLSQNLNRPMLYTNNKTSMIGDVSNDEFKLFVSQNGVNFGLDYDELLKANLESLDSIVELNNEFFISSNNKIYVLLKNGLKQIAYFKNANKVFLFSNKSFLIAINDLGEIYIKKSKWEKLDFVSGNMLDILPYKDSFLINDFKKWHLLTRESAIPLMLDSRKKLFSDFKNIFIVENNVLVKIDNIGTKVKNYYLPNNQGFKLLGFNNGVWIGAIVNEDKLESILTSSDLSKWKLIKLNNLANKFKRPFFIKKTNGHLILVANCQDSNKAESKLPATSNDFVKNTNIIYRNEAKKGDFCSVSISDGLFYAFVNESINLYTLPNTDSTFINVIDPSFIKVRRLVGLFYEVTYEDKIYYVVFKDLNIF